VDVERTIEFILDQQARLQTLMAEHAVNSAAFEERMQRDRAAFEDRTRKDLAEREAIGRRTDARLDRAIRLGVQEARRERQRRHILDEKVQRVTNAVERLEATVQRYIDARGNGHIPGSN
jgi:hypothetical protein